MNRITRLIVIIATTVFFAGCVGESVPPEQAAMEWEDQARVCEKTSEWEEAADAWEEAAEAWEKQADTWEEIGDITQASEAREKAAVDWEAKAKACREAYEWKEAIKAYKRAAEAWETAAKSWEAIEYIQRPEDCSRNAAGCWFNIGTIYQIWLLDAERAVEAYEKAFEIYESIGSDTLAELCRELIAGLEDESS